ncbi:MAG: LysR family transcriptional regulator [Chloroflexi bacterium]|nr:LysR family transcriptional regulator [Chloroflexota bacterium]
MVNDLLNSFVQVIDSGSFSKAAEKLYISSTALMKQMNSLETQVGVQLLIRTNHGVSATPAGTSFYIDAKFMMQYSQNAIVRAKQAASKNPYVIRIGNSILNPCKELLDLWNNLSPNYPQFKMKIVPFDKDAEAWSNVPRTIGKEFDVMVGAYDRADHSDYFQAIKLGEYRFCVTVPREHLLARKERLDVTDLYGERLVMLKPNISPRIDDIRDFLLKEHPQIQLKDHLPHYNIEVFNRCEESGAVLLTLEGWKDVHPSLATIPVDWRFTMPYGILYPLKPSNSAGLFLSALREHGTTPAQDNLDVENQLERAILSVGDYL